MKTSFVSSDMDDDESEVYDPNWADDF